MLFGEQLKSLGFKELKGGEKKTRRKGWGEHIKEGKKDLLVSNRYDDEVYGAHLGEEMKEKTET